MDEVLRLAQRQYALVTRQQALAAGVTDSMIKGRLRAGTWRTVRQGVYAIAGSPRTWEQVVLAACLAGGDGTVVCGPTAAKLWRLPLHGLRLDAVHLLSPRSRRIRLPGVTAHQALYVPASDLARHRGVPVTSVARTIVDVSAELSASQTGRLLDDADRRGLASLEAVRACTARLMGPGRRRIGSIRQALSKRLPGWDPGDSDLEVVALTLIRRAGLPLPVQQHRVKLDGEWFEVDLAYPDVQVAIELDGWDFHRLRSDFDRDERKRALLGANRWHVLPFTTETIQDLPRLVGGLLYPGP